MRTFMYKKVAPKHGFIGLIKTTAVEYAKVCPGFIDNPILNVVPENIFDYTIIHSIPIKRIGKPEEVANTICCHSLHIDGAFSII